MNPMNKNELTGRLMDLLINMYRDRYQLRTGKACTEDEARAWALMTTGDTSAGAAAFAIDEAERRINEAGKGNGFKGFRPFGMDENMPALMHVIFCLEELAMGMYCSMHDADALRIYGADEFLHLSDWARDAAESIADDLNAKIEMLLPEFPRE